MGCMCVSFMYVSVCLCVYLCVCVCVVVFGGGLHRSWRVVVRSFAGGVSVRASQARAARVGHWRSSGRAFDQGRASPSRQLYRYTATNITATAIHHVYYVYILYYDICILPLYYSHVIIHIIGT